MVSAYLLARTDAEIDGVLNLVGDQIDQGTTKFPGMTYEDGLRTGIDWITGLYDDNPMDD